MSAAITTRVVFTTFPPGKAAPALRTLVEERLCACGNIVPGVRSIYRWKGEICDDAEECVFIETQAELVDALLARLRALHPYEVPKMLVLEPCAGNQDYLAWVTEQTARL